MSRWNKSPDDVLFGYEAELWDRYPRHVVRAFFAVSYDDSMPALEGKSDIYNEDEVVAEAIGSFAQRWGGFSDEIFVRVLEQAYDRDRLAAIFAIGHSHLPNAADLLVPFLGSSNLLERYAVAIVLGLRRDERSLPVLEEYLLADDPIVEVEVPQLGQKIKRVQPEAEGWFGCYRPYIAGVLASFGPPSITSVLRHAFLQAWKHEKESEPGPTKYTLHDAIFYALGRRGALGALHGIELPAHRSRLAMIYLILGYIRADERFPDIGGEMLLNKTLQQEVVSIFVEFFALSEKESWEVLASQWDDENKRRNWLEIDESEI